MYWYEMKRGKKLEKRYVADHVVLKGGSAPKYFNNPAINRWGYIDDTPIDPKETNAKHNTNTNL